MAHLKDLAAAANVSIRTVNRVLKKEGYVHEKTLRAVQAAVHRIGYRPNLAARALKTAKSHIVSVLSFTDDELRIAQAAALEKRLREAGYLVSMTFHFESQREMDTRRVVADLLDQTPAGIVLLGHDIFVAQKLLPAVVPAIVRSGIPYVLIDPRGTRYDAVKIDRARGVYDAVGYLSGRGAQRIAYLGPPDRTRLDGYEAALRKLHRPPIHLDFPGLDFEVLRRAGRLFALLKKRPDAIVAQSDFIALGFLAGLHDAGLDIPTDVALIGFDDRLASRCSWPPLTTIAQPSHDIGRAGAEMILKKIAGEKAPSGGWSQSFPTRLVIRETA